MYLKGSKWTMKRRHRRVNFWLVSFLLVMIGVFIYIDLVVVPVTPPLFIPTFTPTRDPKTYAEDASNLYAEGKINQAIDSYQQAIQADPQNANNYIALAEIQCLTGDFKDAQTNAENALLLNKNSDQAYAIRGWALGLQGNYLEAEGAIEQALSINANNPYTHAYYTEILALQLEAGNAPIGTFDKAQSESMKGLDLNSNIMETHRARGILLEVTGNTTDAIKEFETAIQFNDNIASLHESLGETYMINGDYSEAVTELTKAYALDPTNPWPNYYISRTYYQTGDKPLAIQYAELAVKDGPSEPFIEGNLGSMYYWDQQYDKAVTYLRLAVRGGSTDTGATVEGLPLSYNSRVLEYYSRYGLALAYTNQCSEAVQIAQAMLDGVKNDEYAVYNAQTMISTCEQNLSGTSTPTTVSIPSTPTPASP
jgi:tetratricopeptide (TPR) repeat protein